MWHVLYKWAIELLVLFFFFFFPPQACIFSVCSNSVCVLCIGVMAGFNMSSDLHKPEHNIPVGTLAAVFTSYVIQHLQSPYQYDFDYKFYYLWHLNTLQCIQYSCVKQMQWPFQCLFIKYSVYINVELWYCWILQVVPVPCFCILAGSHLYQRCSALWFLNSRKGNITNVTTLISEV